MPKLSSDDVPECLRPYIFHGVDLSWRKGGKEAIADCPFCGREGKFSVNFKDRPGQWQCLVCKEGTAKGGGNSLVFLRRLWDISDDNTKDYDALATERKLLYPTTLTYWGICRSVLTNEWLVPGYDASSKLCQLYRYVEIKGRKRLLATPVDSSIKGHGLFGGDLYSPRKPVVFLCEGPWDAIALWEILRVARATDTGLVSTGNVDKSLLQEASVLATPGCNVFYYYWCPLFSKKIVHILFDNDHPRKHPRTGKEIAPAAFNGLKRAVELLTSNRNPPSQLNWLKWGDLGYDLDQPSGTDVRDLLCRMS